MPDEYITFPETMSSMELMRRYGIEPMVYSIDYFYPIVVRDFYAIFERRAPGKSVLHFSIDEREGMITEKSLA